MATSYIWKAWVLLSIHILHGIGTYADREPVTNMPPWNIRVLAHPPVNGHVIYLESMGAAIHPHSTWTGSNPVMLQWTKAILVGRCSAQMRTVVAALHQHLISSCDQLPLFLKMEKVMFESSPCYDLSGWSIPRGNGMRLFVTNPLTFYCRWIQNTYSWFHSSVGIWTVRLSNYLFELTIMQ